MGSKRLASLFCEKCNRLTGITYYGDTVIPEICYTCGSKLKLLHDRKVVTGDYKCRQCGNVKNMN